MFYTLSGECWSDHSVDFFKYEYIVDGRTLHSELDLKDQFQQGEAYTLVIELAPSEIAAKMVGTFMEYWDCYRFRASFGRRRAFTQECKSLTDALLQNLYFPLPFSLLDITVGTTSLTLPARPLIICILQSWLTGLRRLAHNCDVPWVRNYYAFRDRALLHGHWPRDLKDLIGNSVVHMWFVIVNPAGNRRWKKQLVRSLHVHVDECVQAFTLALFPIFQVFEELLDWQDPVPVAHPRCPSDSFYEWLARKYQGRAELKSVLSNAQPQGLYCL